MWFGVLGPLLVRDGDMVIDVPAARQRVLLAVLLLHAGSMVPADVLAEMVWDGTPPAGAATTLRSHVMRLRRALGPGAGARVVTRHAGYLVEAGEHEVDLLRFDRLQREGNAALRAGSWEQASGLLGEALSMWRGDPLADVPSPRLHRDEAPPLERMRLQALEARIEARLELGYDDELVAELRSLAASYPLRERFHAQLMLALFRSGRQAEALAAYQHVRTLLVQELGADPGTELRRLHQQVLAAAPGLSVRRPTGSAADSRRRAAPRELPGNIRHFTGREAELTLLNTWLAQAIEDPAGMAVISVIGGTAGVGKTALAVHWAYQVAGHFPDGQLYVDLRGYDAGPPKTAPGVLAGFLRALGVPSQDIPAEQDERATRYRSLLAGKRMLIVLDNAGSVEQVRPLLPGMPGCAAVITSRDALAGLVAREGAARLDLDLLPRADAIALLRALIGRRVDAEPGAAQVLADRCCRLPLALRVAAELAAARPAGSLADLACELAGLQQRLDLLDAGGDPRTAMRSVFSWSYQHLDADAARAFRLLGLHPAPDCDVYACAALTGSTVDQSRRVLAGLARAHLIQVTQAERISMHDLLRAYALDLAVTRHTEAERSAALTHLFSYYQHTAAAAMDTLYPAERLRRPPVPPAATARPPVGDTDAARAWLDAQRGNLVVTAAFTSEHGWPGYTVALAAIVHRYLDKGGHYAEAVTIHDCARRAARATGEIGGEATALTNLGTVHGHLGRYQEAADHFRRALALSRDIGDQRGQARALDNLGIIYFYLGRGQQANKYQRQALTLHRQTGDRPGEARVLGNLGLDALRQGRYPQARRYLRSALSLCREIGDLTGEAHNLCNLGDIDRRQGRFEQALTFLRQALELTTGVGDRAEQARILTDLGLTELGQGSGQRAAADLRQALELSRQIGERSAEAQALNALGEAFLAEGQHDEARRSYADALELANLIREQYEQARARDGLARAYHATGDPGQARHHWQRALIAYTGLGAPEADQIRDQLATVT